MLKRAGTLDAPAAPTALLQWGGELHAHLSHAIFRFTDDQVNGY